MAWAEFETIWARMLALEGQTFKTVRNLSLTYTVGDNGAIWINRQRRMINQRVSMSDFKEVYEMMKGPSPIREVGDINKRAIEIGGSQVRGTSYVWAILHDERVVHQG